MAFVKYQSVESIQPVKKDELENTDGKKPTLASVKTK